MRRPINEPKNQNFEKMVGLKVHSNLKQLELKPEKNSGLNGIQTQSCDDQSCLQIFFFIV